MVDRDLLAAKLAELEDRVTRVRARVPDADAARTPLHDERRRLIVELDEFTDLSTNKYAHVAAAVLDADD
jgi:hypothetical protein